MADQETTIPRAAPSFVPAAPSPRATAPARPFSLGHRPALDGVRGLAILAVLGVHSVPMFMGGGYHGVDVFFVLSGFLITALLLEEHRAQGSIKLRAFYLRRGLRLLPALVAMLLICWLSALVFQSSAHAHAIRSDALSILLYYFNWTVALHPTLHVVQLVPLWSPSLEEQFYLLWPPVLAALLALRVRRRWILALILLGIAGPLLERIVLYPVLLNQPLGLVRLYVCPDTHSDGLFCGCLVALLAFHRLSIRNLWVRRLLGAAAWVALLALAANCFYPPPSLWYMCVASYSVVNLCTAVVLAALVWAPPPLLVWCLERRWLGWIGRVSYGLYLWNGPIFLLADAWLSKLPFPAKVLLSLAAAVAVSAISFYCLEQPFLRLKHKFNRRVVHPVSPPRMEPAANRAA